MCLTVSGTAHPGYPGLKGLLLLLLFGNTGTGRLFISDLSLAWSLLKTHLFVAV